MRITQANMEARIKALLFLEADKLSEIDELLFNKGTDDSSKHTSYRLFSFTEAAKQLHCSRATIYRLVADKRLNPVQLRPTCRRIREDELLKISRG